MLVWIIYPPGLEPDKKYPAFCIAGAGVDYIIVAPYCRRIDMARSGLNK